MNPDTTTELLRNADPLRHEPERPADERDRLRHAVVAAASGPRAASAGPSRQRITLLTATTLTAIVLAMVLAVLGLRIWSQEGGTLQAAVRFEIRLAEDRPAAGLTEARAAGSDKVVYLHPEVVVDNSDIAGSRVVQGDSPSQFGVAVEFNAMGSRKMRQATANHIGKLLAILIDGDVVAAPRVRAPISTSALLTGDLTRAEAERIVNGIIVR